MVVLVAGLVLAFVPRGSDVVEVSQVAGSDSALGAALDATNRLGGANYVLWGGREGYETLLNTRIKHESDQLARFLHMVVEHKRNIGFDGMLLIEPKPQEPTKHQYDYDSATVHGFLERYDLLGEYFVNIEANHATLAGHSFHHEVAYAVAHGIFGSIDANRGDPQNGWDTDQFPTNMYDCVHNMLVILGAGGLGSGGLNFDAKVRRESTDPEDLFMAHIGGMDAYARALIIAERVLRDGRLEKFRSSRYASFDQRDGARFEAGELDLADLRDIAANQSEPAPASGRQEWVENLINDFMFG